jgi:hypothetical protein
MRWLCDSLFGAPLGSLGPRDVDLMRLLSEMREDRDAIREHFDETKGDCKIVLLLPDSVPQLADLEGGQQWRVSWQDAEIPLRPGELHLIDLFADEGAFRCDDFERE